MEFFVHYGHLDDPNDLSSLTVPPNECVVELMATCRNCREITKTHLDRQEYVELRRRYRDDWARGFFLYLGWDISTGLCADCYRDVRRVKELLH